MKTTRETKTALTLVDKLGLRGGVTVDQVWPVTHPRGAVVEQPLGARRVVRY